MASAFWILEDGRGIGRRWTGMAYMLELITDELKTINGAEEFYIYLERFVYREDRGDTPNGYGGFIRGDEDFLFNIDLRTFAPLNKAFFWQAAQKAMDKLKTQNGYEGMIALFTLLLDMHKRIKRGEAPMLFNDIKIVHPDTDEKLGPGW